MLWSKYAKKAIWMIVLMFTLGFSMNVQAKEAEDHNDYSNEVVPGHEKTSRWSYTNSVAVAMTLDTEGYVTVNCGVYGYQDMTTKIITYIYLQKRVGDEWVNMGAITDVSYGWHADIEDYFDDPMPWGYDYRTRNSIYVYADNEYEHVEAFSLEHHYHSVDGIPDCSRND